MKVIEKMKAFLPVGFLCIFVFFVIVAFGYGSLEFNGFGVDSNELLYVGRLHQIEVYNEGEQIKEITTPADRGWVMTVDEMNNIVVSNMSTIFLLDTEGTVVATQNDIHGEKYYEIRNIQQIRPLDEDMYELKYKWIWPTIQKNGSNIYQAPVVDFVTRMLFALGSIFMLIGIVANKWDNCRR